MADRDTLEKRAALKYASSSVPLGLLSGMNIWQIWEIGVADIWQI